MDNTKDYSKSYYEKNKDRLKERAKERRKQAKQGNYLSLVPEQTKSDKSPASVTVQPQIECVQDSVQGVQVQVSRIQGLKTLGLALLGSVITLLLLHQMLEFYSADPIPLRWMKALATEGLVIFFSTLKHPSIWYRILYRLIAFGMCLLSIYTMSAKQLETHALNTQKHEAAVQAVQEIQASIKEKQTIQEQFTTNKWLTAARENSKILDQLNAKLENSRLNGLETLSPVHSLIVQVLTRIFFMLGNILIAQKLLNGFKDSSIKLTQ